MRTFTIFERAFKAFRDNPSLSKLMVVCTVRFFFFLFFFFLFFRIVIIILIVRFIVEEICLQQMGKFGFGLRK